MDISYAVTPFLAWLMAGGLKFCINSLRAGKPAFALIGYGGMPSNHSAIVSSMAALIAFRQGIGDPAFGVALSLAFIVMLDANSLRRQVGRHAEAINRLAEADARREARVSIMDRKATVYRRAEPAKPTASGGRRLHERGRRPLSGNQNGTT